MARKSNKTAHVLNLLAGHDTQPASADETPDTRPSAKDGSPDTASPADGRAAAKDTADSADSRTAAGSAPAQNISVIDTTGEDPVANLIQRNLSAQFDDETNIEAADLPSTEDMAAPDSDSTDFPAADPKAAAEDSIPSEADLIAEPSLAAADATDVTVPTPEPLSDPAPVSVPTPDPVSSVPVPDPESVPGPGPTTVPKKEEPKPEPEPEPEPDFIYLNVMEAIVRDKIIYFMRQFDVCTCDRCVADTIALALNGLTPKYIVTSPAAVDPLIGFYTNKLISDITVEATKACITIKDNPRH